MLRILNKEMTKTLDMKTLEHLLPHYVKVARYDQLLKSKTLKDAMGSASVLILLFNIHDAKHRVLNQSPAMGIIVYKSFVNLRSDPREFPEKLPSFCAPCPKMT